MIKNNYILEMEFRTIDLTHPVFAKIPIIKALNEYLKNKNWGKYSRLKKIKEVKYGFVSPEVYTNLTDLLKRINLSDKNIYEKINRELKKSGVCHYRGWIIYKKPLTHGKRESKEQTS